MQAMIAKTRMIGINTLKNFHFVLRSIKFQSNYTSYCELCQVFTTDYINAQPLFHTSTNGIS